MNLIKRTGSRPVKIQPRAVISYAVRILANAEILSKGICRAAYRNSSSNCIIAYFILAISTNFICGFVFIAESSSDIGNSRSIYKFLFIDRSSMNQPVIGNIISGKLSCSLMISKPAIVVRIGLITGRCQSITTGSV